MFSVCLGLFWFFLWFMFHSDFVILFFGFVFNVVIIVTKFSFSHTTVCCLFSFVNIVWIFNTSKQCFQPKLYFKLFHYYKDVILQTCLQADHCIVDRFKQQCHVWPKHHSDWNCAKKTGLLHKLL